MRACVFILGCTSAEAKAPTHTDSTHEGALLLLLSTSICLVHVSSNQHAVLCGVVYCCTSNINTAVHACENIRVLVMKICHKPQSQLTEQKNKTLKKAQHSIFSAAAVHLEGTAVHTSGVADGRAQSSVCPGRASPGSCACFLVQRTDACSKNKPNMQPSAHRGSVASYANTRT